MLRNQNIPRWIIGYAIFQLALAILFGSLAYFNRGFQFPELVGNVDALFPIGLFANRNLGVAAVMIIALVLRNRAMLMGLFMIRFATDLFDFLLSAFGTGIEGAGAWIGTFVFFGLVLWGPELLAIRSLWSGEQLEE